MNAVRATVLFLLLVTVGPLAAQPLGIMEPEPGPVGRVATPRAFADHCLAPIEISRVDGEAVSAPLDGLLVAPGRHRLNGRAILDRKRCRALEDDLVIPPADDLVVNVEAGKVYSIAYDRSHPDPRNWRLVVWKVEDMAAEAPRGPERGR